MAQETGMAASVGTAPRESRPARRCLGGGRSATIRSTSEEIGVSAYADRLEALADEAADRCTGCGKCFEVCPTAREIGLAASEAKLRVGELVDLTRGAAPAE